MTLKALLSLNYSLAMPLQHDPKHRFSGLVLQLERGSSSMCMGKCELLVSRASHTRGELQVAVMGCHPILQRYILLN